MSNVWLRVAKVAEMLDRAGFYAEADELSRLLVRQAQVAGPQNLNIPLRDRVWDGRQVIQDAEETDRRRLKDPRLRTPDYIALPGGDDTQEEKEFSIFDMQGEDAIPGPAYVDPYPSPSMKGNLKDYEYSNFHDSGDPYGKYKPRA